MNRKRERIALFGGTFDPIHFGHLHLALALLEAHQLDQVIFCPALISPFKGASPPQAGKKERKQMLQLAIDPIPSFRLLDVELDRVGLSYTIDTIKDVLRKRQNDDLFLILGEDALEHFHLWKDVEEIIRLAPPLIGSRVIQTSPSFDKLPSHLQSALSQGLTQIPLMEISSTAIRQRLAQSLYCGHLLPLTVLEYISTHKLYLE